MKDILMFHLLFYISKEVNSFLRACWQNTLRFQSPFWINSNYFIFIFFRMIFECVCFFFDHSIEFDSQFDSSMISSPIRYCRFFALSMNEYSMNMLVPFFCWKTWFRTWQMAQTKKKHLWKSRKTNKITSKNMTNKRYSRLLIFICLWVEYFYFKKIHRQITPFSIFFKICFMYKKKNDPLCLSVMMYFYFFLICGWKILLCFSLKILF